MKSYDLTRKVHLYESHSIRLQDQSSYACQKNSGPNPNQKQTQKKLKERVGEQKK